MNNEFTNYIQLNGTEKLKNLSDNTPYLIFGELFSSTYPIALYKHLTSKGIQITRCLLKFNDQEGLTFIEEDYDFVADRLLINSDFHNGLNEIIDNNEDIKDDLFYKKGTKIMDYNIDEFLSFIVNFNDYIYANTRFDDFSSKFHESDTDELKKFRATL